MAAKTSASNSSTPLPQKLDAQILKNDSSDVGRFADDLKELIRQAAGEYEESRDPAYARFQVVESNIRGRNL